MKKFVATLVLASMAAWSQPPQQTVITRMETGIRRLDESLMLASVTLRLQQLLNTVTDAQRRTQLDGLVTRWFQSGVPPQELAQWNASFDQAAEGVFARLTATAQNSADREGALSTLQMSRARLRLQRTLNEDLTVTLGEAIGILDLGQPVARYGGWFDGIDEELEGLLLAQASRPAQTPAVPAGPGAPAFPVTGANTTTRQNLAFGKPSVWDMDLQRDERIDEIVLTVRREYAERGPAFQVIVAPEGSPWKQVYSSTGASMGVPLVIRLNGERARRVAIMWAQADVNPFDRIEIYAGGSTVTQVAPPIPPIVAPIPAVVPPTPPSRTSIAPGGTPAGLATPSSTINLALGKPTTTSSRSSYSTPSESGGVDGVKNGMFGFHTNNEPNPWWEVDLQQPVALGEIRVFNYRENGVVADRSRTLRALVSLDGVNWQQVHNQNGRTFGGDGQPLRILLNAVPARWVRLQLSEANWLHLDEVEVYAAATSVSTATPTRPSDAIFIPATVSGGGSGVFIGSDTTTQGNWRNLYGREGAMLATESAGVAFRGATVTPKGKNDYSWGTTADLRGLLRVDRSERLGAAWYADPTFEVEIALINRQPARLTAYFIDWDSSGRSQRVELIDTATNAVLDTRTLSNFVGGQYLTWRISSRATLRITKLAGPNAVVSGIFLDSDSAAAPAISSSATFLSNDAATRGNWKSVYGRDGAVIVGDGASPSAFVFTPVGKADYAWGATQEPRALTRLNGTDRMAALWYAEGSFEVEIQPPAVQPYRLAAYFLDWDVSGRSERVELLDVATGAVLDSRTVSAFQNGQYLSWRISGRVKLRLTRLAGPNAGLSGLFVDRE